MSKQLIGQKIAQFREACGLSQSELARRLNVKPQAVQKWEAGGAPRMHRIEEIAHILGVDPRDLIGAAQPLAPPGDATWPFSVAYARYAALTDIEKARLDGLVVGFIESTQPFKSGTEG